MQFPWQKRARACLKNHSCNLHAPLCGIFHPNSVVVARYDALIRAKSPTNCDAHLAESLFQTLLFFYYPSEEYISCLMTEELLLFFDEINTEDLFEGNNNRERIAVFTVG